MTKISLIKKDVLNDLPPESDNDLLDQICQRVENSHLKIVILDDDPTGTQTIHGLPVLTTWDVDTLKNELLAPENAFFILTNSRGLTQAAAVNLARQIGSNLRYVSKATGIELSVISRSDSTLRGHFPLEVDAFASVFEDKSLPYLICPFFLEGGRYTIDDIHYVAEGEKLVPASQTPFAGDAAFGFSHSNLCKWIEEKTKGDIKADQVIPVSINDIRHGGPEKVTQVLLSVPNNSACIVNAVSYRDIEVLVTGLLDALAQGKDFLYRTAASFVRVRLGIKPKQSYLTKIDLLSDFSSDLSGESAKEMNGNPSYGNEGNGGLFIVGSYVPKTTAQVSALLDQTDIFPIIINVDHLLDPVSREHEIKGAQSKLNETLAKGLDTLIYTSRDLVVGDDPDASLKIGQAVSSSLIKLVKGLKHQPRYLVAKGGITSSDVATKGLNIKRAMVIGQALPGVPVWKTGPESKYPGMSYMIFPGNVGDDTALVQILQKLI